LHLTSEQVAAAEAAGCTFLPAPPDAVHRYAMQRKLFHVGEQQVLATRGGGLFETAATLERLIAEGRARLGAVVPAAESAVPETMPVETAPPEPEATPAEPGSADTTPEAPRVRTRRPRAAKPASVPMPGIDAMAPAPGDAAQQAAASVVRAPRRRAKQDEAPRWSTAGAARRGRAAVHWSTRNR
jgi:hypothetical protein